MVLRGLPVMLLRGTCGIIAPSYRRHGVGLILDSPFDRWGIPSEPQALTVPNNFLNFYSCVS